MKKKDFGFSLIELSIVLIIIGVLIIGIVGGTTLIKNSKIRGILNEVKGIETGLYAYYAANGFLPTTDGNSDGILFSNNCNTWKSLYDEKIVDFRIDNCDSEDITVINTDSSLPSSKDKNLFYVVGFNENLLRNTLFLVSKESSGIEKMDTLSKLSHIEGSEIKEASFASVSNEIAKNIDVKSDDGLMDSGRIQAFSAKNRTGNE